MANLYPNERICWDDPVTGVPVTRWSSACAHTHHFYFTNEGIWDGGKQILVGSERATVGRLGGAPNLWSIDRQSGAWQAMTDWERSANEVIWLFAALNPVRPEVYVPREGWIVAMELPGGRERKLAKLPEGYRTDILNVTADGKTVCFPVVKNLSGQKPADLLRGYVGFVETFEATRDSRIWRVSVDNGGVEELRQEESWIGHVNTSPTQPHLLSYCHEGPWDRVDNRIWMLDLRDGRVWPLCERERPGDRIGHEYWYADGVRLGYHGTIDGVSVLGHLHYDGSNRVEASFPGETGHIHSRDEALIVGDGGGVIRLWRREEEGYSTPRLLCRHESSWRIQKAHPHPRFTPDGKAIIFTSDRSDYCQVHEVPVVDFDSLPEIEE